MSLLFIAGCLAAPPWVESQDFPQPKQEAALAATLRLRVDGREGTAVRVGSHGPMVYYLTADHCLGKDAKAVFLDRFTKESLPAPADTYEGVRVLWRLPEIDLAVLQTLGGEKAPCLPVCPEAKTPKPAAGTQLPVLTVGCSDGQAPELALDRIGPRKLIHKDAQRSSPRIGSWQTDRAGTEGRSGGPMVGSDGFLIGICNGTAEGHSYYLHADEIRKALNDKRLGILIGTPPGGNADPNAKK